MKRTKPKKQSLRDSTGSQIAHTYSSMCAYCRCSETGDQEAVQDADGLFVRRLPAELLRDINIVDTPGTNVIVDRQQRLTEEYVPRADLVLFCMSAGQCIDSFAFLDVLFGLFGIITVQLQSRAIAGSALLLSMTRVIEYYDIVGQASCKERLHVVYL